MLIYVCRLGGCAIITKEITILPGRWKVYLDETMQGKWRFNLGSELYGRTRSAALYMRSPNRTMCKEIECGIRKATTFQVLNMKPFFPLPGLFIAGRQVKQETANRFKFLLKCHHIPSQVFRQYGADGHYLRINPIFTRWEITEQLDPLANSDQSLFVSVSCYSLCPANILEITNFIGNRLSWASRKWGGLEICLSCTEHTHDA